MSGHSHFSTIKHKKETSDKKRGKIFSKMARLISVAAKEKGANPEMNPKLRLAIERARDVNMPKENIERAIKKGSGETEEGSFKEIIYEAYGPGGIALIIECITDNRNRTLNELRQVLSRYDGKLAENGAVKWLFEKKGCIVIDPKSQIKELENKEGLELLAIESGAEDIYWHDDILDVYVKIEDLENTKKSLKEKDIKTESASIDWVPKTTLEINEKNKNTCQNLFEALDENDDTQEIYSNIKL